MSRTREKMRAMVLVLALAGCSGGTMNQGSGQPSIDVADVALNGGSPRIALQVAQGILSRKPDDVRALLVQGDALTQLGRNDDATAAFDQALKRDPGSTHAKIGLGRIRLTSDPAAAVDLFQDVLRQDARNINALVDLGIGLDLLGRHAEAQDAYRQVRSIKPENVAAQVNLALSLALSGDSDGALRMIEPLASAPDASTKLRHNHAAVLAMAGREADAARVMSRDLPAAEVDQAIAAYRRGLERDSVSPRTAPANSGTPPTPSNAPVAPVAKAPLASPPVRARMEPVLASSSISPASVAVEQANLPMPVVQRPTQAAMPEVPPNVSPNLEQTASEIRSPAPAALSGSVIPVPKEPLTADSAVNAEAPVQEKIAPAAIAMAKPAVAIPTTSATVPSSISVQLGALPSKRAAQAEWHRLAKLLPDLLGDRRPAISTTTRGGAVFWRLRTDGFPDLEAAQGFCARLRSASDKCLVLRT
jgi:Flp pilus assembly protein TadD